MLTKNDLFQIKKIVGDEIKKEINPVKKDVSGLKQNISDIGNDIAKIRKDINIIVSAFDNEYVDLRRRIERLENHLNLSPIN